MSALVEVVERIGAAAVDRVTDFVNIHGDDSYSATENSIAVHPIRGRDDGAPQYSTERWVRLRFNPPFTSARAFRFWCPGLVVPTGWSLLYGTAEAFATPTNAPSQYAQFPVPGADPGEASPNIGGEVPLEGAQTQYSRWIVLQASANADAATGAMLGYEAETHLPIPVLLRFNWIEN